jgi:predicted RNA-binding Zn-ribbon protein involved in translation (DUF1610 family)
MEIKISEDKLDYLKDVVFDGFAGTGMVGVAANLCSNPGNDYKNLLQLEWQKNFGKLPNWGQRKAICSDLSPVASLIAAGYNSSSEPILVNERLSDILQATLKEIDWTLETKHTDGSKGTINNVVWSDVFKCPNCTNEIIYWDSAIDHENGTVKESFNCPSCNVELTKRDLEKSWETLFDLELNETVTLTKSKPLIIGKNSIIGAGSVVLKDVPSNVTVIGNPARVLNKLI